MARRTNARTHAPTQVEKELAAIEAGMTCPIRLLRDVGYGGRLGDYTNIIDYKASKTLIEGIFDQKMGYYGGISAKEMKLAMSALADRAERMGYRLSDPAGRDNATSPAFKEYREWADDVAKRHKKSEEEQKMYQEKKQKESAYARGRGRDPRLDSRGFPTDHNIDPTVRVLTYMANYAFAYADLLRAGGAQKAGRSVEIAAKAALAAEDDGDWYELRAVLEDTLPIVQKHKGLVRLCQTLIFQITEDALDLDPATISPDYPRD